MTPAHRRMLDEALERLNARFPNSDEPLWTSREQLRALFAAGFAAGVKAAGGDLPPNAPKPH